MQPHRLAPKIRSRHTAMCKRHREFLTGLPRARRIDSPCNRLLLVLRQHRASLRTHRTASMFATFLPTYCITLACNVPMARRDARVTVVRVVMRSRTHAITTFRHTVERPHRNLQGVESLAHSSSMHPLVRARRQSAEHAAFPRLRSTMLRTRAPQPAADGGAPTAGPPRGIHVERPRLLAAPLSSAPPPLPPAELSRVTEHVIRQLDRRVLSYRERTGQV